MIPLELAVLLLILAAICFPALLVGIALLCSIPGFIYEGFKRSPAALALISALGCASAIIYAPQLGLLSISVLAGLGALSLCLGARSLQASPELLRSKLLLRFDQLRKLSIGMFYLGACLVLIHMLGCWLSPAGFGKPFTDPSEFLIGGYLGVILFGICIYTGWLIHSLAKS